MIEKKFGIIGKPLSHSLSPTLHNFWFKKYKISASYSLIEIELNKIEATIKKIRNGELHGINVTLPYKQAVIPYLDLIVDDAKETLSVNTINLNEEGKVVGNNTDVYGIEQGFLERLVKQNLEKKKIMILGAGGVTPSVIYALSKKGFKKIFISNRTIKKLDNIKKNFSFIEIINWEDVEEKVKNMDIIINATTLGLKDGDDFKQDFKGLKNNLVYYDIVYNPEETMMMKKLKKKALKLLMALKCLYIRDRNLFLCGTNLIQS